MSPRYSSKTRQESMDTVREELLEAAVREIASQGFSAANINTISLAAGYAKGTIYNYFPSKRELMFAILEQSAREHLETISERVDQELDPNARLKLFFQAGFQFVQENPARARVLISTLFGTDDEFKARLYQLYQPMFDLVADQILQPGLEQGLFRLTDLRESAAMIMNFYLGTASNVDPSGKPLIDPSQAAEFAQRALQPWSDR